MSTREIFGLKFSCLSLQQIVDHLVAELPGGHEAKMLFTTNLDHIVRMRSSEAFRQAYDRAALITMDGFPVYLYAKWRGLPIPGRVTGADLLPALVQKLSPAQHRPFFVVSDEFTAASIRRILALYGFDDVETYIPTFGFDQNEKVSEYLASQIFTYKTTHLFFCVGSPKSEIWLSRYQHLLGPCYAMSFGAGANFFAGTATRAPRWLQRVGGEWLWRFAKEPRRLFRRYFIESWAFFLAIAEDSRSRSVDRNVKSTAKDLKDTGAA